MLETLGWAPPLDAGGELGAPSVLGGAVDPAALSPELPDLVESPAAGALSAEGLLDAGEPDDEPPDEPPDPCAPRESVL